MPIRDVVTGGQCQFSKFPLNVSSLQNPKNFRTCKPIKFRTQVSFIHVKQFSNATFFRQIASQNLQHKSFGFSETVSGWITFAWEFFVATEHIM